MKKLIAVLLIITMTLSACSFSANKKTENAYSKSRALSTDVVKESKTTKKANSVDYQKASEDSSAHHTAKATQSNIFESYTGNAKDLSDEVLLRFIEDSIYSDLVSQLDSEDYFVESVNTIYVSQEYLEELSYNSQANIYFGYTLDEINKLFQGTKYVFTLNENGETEVIPFEEYYDDTFDTIVKNVAIGTGVILVCVTVSVVTAGAAPAVSLIFAAAAKTATVCALSGGAISAASAAVVTGIQTGDVEESLKAAGVAGSTGFKMGAISGALAGGAKEAKGLYNLTQNGLTMNQAAIIQRESRYPAEIIKQFRNFNEYTVYKDTAKLQPQMVNNQLALVRDIDVNYVDPDSGLTNLELMAKGRAPLDPATGKTYELHHVGQKMKSTLAILTEAEHDMPGLHVIEESQIDRIAFKKIRKDFWKSMATILGGA